MTTPSWQDRAAQKRNAILAAILPEWRIADPPSVEETGRCNGIYQAVSLTRGSADYAVRCGAARGEGGQRGVEG